MANKSEVARIVIQQCLSASLVVRPAKESNPAEVVKIGKGMIVYVSFFKDATLDCIPKIVKSVTNVKLIDGVDGRLLSAMDTNADLLLIPQACLAGKLKGTSVQYHGLADKITGESLYTEFVNACEKELGGRETQHNVKCGIYGNRQVLNVDTNGPFTHVFDF